MKTFFKKSLVKIYKMSVAETYEDTWSCPRCYRYNFSPDTDELCLNGCGYSMGDSIYKQLGWECPQCDTKNSTKMFTSYTCRICNYGLNIDELKKAIYE